MYIHGDMTTAKFAVIENPRTYQFEGRWTDYTERFAYAKIHAVTRNFIQEVSWMTKDHSYVIHFCHNGIEDICDDTPDIKTDGKSLLFAYDVFMMTRDEKSYTTEELIRYANHHYDYRYTPENIYGFGFDDVTVDDIDNGLKMAEPIAKMNIDRKVIYEDELADYQKRIEENHRREERELKKAQQEREEHQEIESEIRERAKREYEERVQRERAEREERERRERERRQREQEEREQREREERELNKQKEELLERRKHTHQWAKDVAAQLYEKQVAIQYDMPFAQFGAHQMDTIENIIQKYFDTKFYNIASSHTCYYVPKDVYNELAISRVDEDICVAQTTTLNVSAIPAGVLVDGIVNLFQEFERTMWEKPHEDINLMNVLKHNQHYVFKFRPTAELQNSDRGLELHLGLVPHEWDYNYQQDWDYYRGDLEYLRQKPKNGQWDKDFELKQIYYWKIFTGKSRWNLSYAPDDSPDFIFATKTRVAEFIREWKQTHKHVIDRVRHNEDAWWSVDRLPFVNPKPNTNLLYVAYLPQTDVIKVGRTQNWESRENAYRRISGPTPETTGDVRLCYVYETPTVGDAAIDKWLLYCAEDHIKQFARERMDLVGGNEFFRGQPIQDFCVAVDEYFKTLTTQDIIHIRPEHEAKQFALQNNYHVERFLDALEQL